MTSENLIDFQGQIERITYTNEENGYTIARVKVYGRRELVTVIGSLFHPAPGEIIRMKGRWSNHPQYGEQFKIVSCQCTTPASVYGMEKYLGSGLIKGVGPVMARRIVRKFKEETLNVIEHDIDKLSLVPGIGGKRIEMIKKAWEEQKEIRQVMLFLQSHDVTPGYAARIFRQYGNDSIRVVKENPYRLATDVAGIGFITADRIAEKLGFARDSALRAEAGILYVLSELADEGHVYYPYEALIAEGRKILEVEREIVAEAINAVGRDRRIVIEACLERMGKDSSINAGETVDTGRAVYLAPFYISETNIAVRLASLARAPEIIRKIDAQKAVQWVQEKLHITLADKQIEAVRCAARQKVMVITGGPGTGKTTIIKAILRIFSAVRAKIMLAAPTGRAAKRMSEATGYEAKTIHRMLEYSMQKSGFQKNDQSPLNCHLLVVDEASMIDTILMHHLLKAVPVRATLILVGDVNQLPSVGAGNVLKDIIDSGTVPVVELTEIFRQARDSSIIVNAHKINEGTIPYLKSSPEKLQDFYFIPEEEPEKVLALIITLVRERIPKRFHFDPFDDIQVLTPMHRGTVGAENLNMALQKALNPRDDGIIRGGRNFRIGDKVMQIRNNYNKDVYNGDIGRITGIDEEAQEVTVTIDERQVTYDYGELDELVHAYAVSVHKSQGSEYPAAVIPIVTQHYMLLQRNLLYTAVTRGRKLVVLVGSKRALAIAVKNNKTHRRYTLLKQRLIANF
ncbi:MAG: recombinase RecD [Syntrophaceae bacterium CG2_30_49_12]|nr:MAG: recombinase RecD [Syntrophaceae bacterium CG2_30_49_12]PIP06292.1 MAG: ATP-dependent RecD-like DNA helicase [Syntrophobacterales bacterium CG23_combo_of_CG06-09_8_20_14_all_48_27]PJC74033.1 MAG: ATP-dependent RecD-like DNA helicase [Syntrophobacterales bacterium CG_4_8_14_3_um_filter_49_14]